MQGPGAKRSDCHASWRDVLPIHPAAEMVEAATNEERRVLRRDLKQHGQREPVVLVRIGQGCEQLLDGRTRLDLQEANGDDVIGADGKLTVPHRIVELPDDAAAISYVLSLNLFRRHLTPKQKRELIDKLLKAMPEKSNRQIAKTVGVSHPHVAKVRKALEKSGDVETVTTSVDTKGRKQPAKKAKKAKQPAEKKLARIELVEPVNPVKPFEHAAAAPRGDIGATSTEAERLEARNEQLENKCRQLEFKLKGLESENAKLKTENAELRAKLEATRGMAAAASSKAVEAASSEAHPPTP